MGDASEGGGLVVGEGNIGIILTAYQPPTCYISVTVSSQYLPNADDSSLNITMKFPFTTQLWPHTTKTWIYSPNAVYDFISNTGEDSNIFGRRQSLTVNYYDDFDGPIRLYSGIIVRQRSARQSWMNTIFETTSAARGRLQSSKQTEVRLLAPLFSREMPTNIRRRNCLLLWFQIMNIRPQPTRRAWSGRRLAHIQKVYHELPD